MDVSPPMNMYDWHKTIHYLIFPQSLARSDKKSSLRPVQSQSDLRLASNSIILLAAQIINDRSITFGYEPFAMAKPFFTVFGRRGGIYRKSLYKVASSVPRVPPNFQYGWENILEGFV